MDKLEIRRIINGCYYGTDLDKEFDVKSMVDELAEYFDEWIKADRINQEYNAVWALKKISKMIDEQQHNRIEIIANVLYGIKLNIENIIADTYGPL